MLPRLFDKEVTDAVGNPNTVATALSDDELPICATHIESSSLGAVLDRLDERLRVQLVVCALVTASRTGEASATLGIDIVSPRLIGRPSSMFKNSLWKCMLKCTAMTEGYSFFGTLSPSKIVPCLVRIDEDGIFVTGAAAAILFKRLSSKVSCPPPVTVSAARCQKLVALLRAAGRSVCVHTLLFCDGVGPVPDQRLSMPAREGRMLLDAFRSFAAQPVTLTNVENWAANGVALCGLYGTDATTTISSIVASVFCVYAGVPSGTFGSRSVAVHLPSHLAVVASPTVAGVAAAVCCAPVFAGACRHGVLFSTWASVWRSASWGLGPLGRCANVVEHKLAKFGLPIIWSWKAAPAVLLGSRCPGSIQGPVRVRVKVCVDSKWVCVMECWSAFIGDRGITKVYRNKPWPDSNSIAVSYEETSTEC